MLLGISQKKKKKIVETAGTSFRVPGKLEMSVLKNFLLFFVGEQTMLVDKVAMRFHFQEWQDRTGGSKTPQNSSRVAFFSRAAAIFLLCQNIDHPHRGGG